MSLRGPAPLVISHRTNMGTHPENSLAGIDAAIAARADGVELDVRATADGVPVLLHDATLERTHGDPRVLASQSFAELASLETPLPTLAQALTAVRGRARLCIELKDAGLEAEVARLVRAAAAIAWCQVWAFDPAVGVASREAAPDVPVALNVSRASGEHFGYDSCVDVALAEGFAAISLDRALVSQKLVRRAHRAGLAVYTWTVDDPSEVERVTAAAVDALCGNDPARVRAALEAYLGPTR